MGRKENNSDRGAEEEEITSETVADGCYVLCPVSVLAILCVLTDSVLIATFWFGHCCYNSCSPEENY